MMREITLLDDRTRPIAPKLPGVTVAQRRHGQQLAMIHRLHLQQLDEVQLAMDQAQRGADPKIVRDAVASLDMVTNYRRFANLCGRECQALTYHHRSEDDVVFPAVRRFGPGIAPVLDRLIAEHGIVAALLENLMKAAVALAEDPSRERFTLLGKTFATLEGVVRSHFGYEEVQLEEAIGGAEVPF